MIKIYLMILILLFILAFILIYISRKKGKLNTEIQIIESQKYIKNIITESLNKEEINKLNIHNIKEADSKMVGNIWGHDVIVFEIIINSNEDVNIYIIQKELNIIFKKYVDSKLLKSYINVTDIWILNEELHLEIIHLINNKTKSYFRDIQKIKNIK